MIVVVPPITPGCRSPPVLPIVATAVLLLVHTPPDTGLVRVAVLFAHIADGPLIVPGVGLTVMILVLKQPPGST